MAFVWASWALWASTSARDTAPSPNWRSTTARPSSWMRTISRMAAICPRIDASDTAVVTMFEASDRRAPSSWKAW